MTWPMEIPTNGTTGLLSGLLSRGGPQSKKLAYLAVIGAGIVWLSIGLWIPIRDSWNVAFALLLGAVTTGYVGGKKVSLAGLPAPEAQASASDSASGSAKIGGGA